MPRSQLFYKYLETCFNKLQQSLEGYMTTGDRVLLFTFRVSIKKIRTCIKCIEDYHGEQEFKHTRKQFRKMFREGGSLRELHIYRDWFLDRNLEGLIEIIGLEKSIHRKEKAFVKEKDKMLSVIRDSKEFLLSYANKLSQTQVYSFYIKLLREHISQLLGKMEKTRLHKMRKEIKRILYARHWQNEEGLRVLSKRQAIFLDQFQHLIGYWHDNEDMIVWLKEQRSNYGDAENARDRLAFRKAFQLLKEKEDQFYKKVVDKQRQCKRVLTPLSRRLKMVAIAA